MSKLLGVGTKFYAAHADGNPQWTVTEDRGNGMWVATIEEGAERGFMTYEIEHALSMARIFDTLSKSKVKWWDAQVIGTILHYHNGFGQYVRGVVTTNKDGRKEFLPQALVGEWKTHDLPKRQSDGSISRPHQAKSIFEGNAWRPSETCVFEHQNFSRPMGPARSVNPTTLAPIDLSVPDMTDEEAEAARRQKVRQDMAAILADWRKAPDQCFVEIRNLMETV